MALLRVRDRWFRILIILIPAIVVVSGSRILPNLNRNVLLKTIISIVAVVLICEGSRMIIYQSRRWFRGGLRIMIVIPAGLLFISIILALAVLLREFVVSGTWETSPVMDSNIVINDRMLILGLWGFALLNAVFIFPVLLVAYEIIYHYAQLRDAARQRERLEKEKLKAELQQLKGIVNPHFLFNNLNSLSSLIAEDPVKAQDFLDELTKVFRYLLRNNDTELTTLASELDFINSYYRLLQIRYDAAISMDIRIDKLSEQRMIPPLTLQLLIENAVKHNRLQKDEPLRIELFTQPGNKLTVRNNLLKKDGKVESTGIGLQNINARYRMLRIPEAEIEKMDGSFSVVISLIESKVG